MIFFVSLTSFLISSRNLKRISLSVMVSPVSAVFSTRIISLPGISVRYFLSKSAEIILSVSRMDICSIRFFQLPDISRPWMHFQYFQRFVCELNGWAFYIYLQNRWQIWQKEKRCLLSFFSKAEIFIFTVLSL